MKLLLNPYTLVIHANGTYHFFFSDHNDPIKVTADQEQLELLELLYSGASCDHDHMCTVLGTPIVEALIRTGCLTPYAVDTRSLFSRTNAFFLANNMPDARAQLSGKKILILGCGGIGTHMAWHMATLGVAWITLVDFDVVEISNLNRQLLFDASDAGLMKTGVLKSKLLAINPDIHIETICKRIRSEEELEAICLAEEYDLIIKALDSPAEFPIWLDHVANKHSLTYITGITMRENVLIGPTFIPGVSSVGWSDLTDIGTNTASKVFGVAPSLGVMLYHISDELAIEAFKILSGYGKPKYVNKMLSRNIFTDESHWIEKKKKREDISEEAGRSPGGTFAVNIILMIAMAMASIQVSWCVLLSLAIAMVTPFILFKSGRDVVRCTFVNSAVVAVGHLIRYIHLLDMSTMSTMISSAVILFGVHSVTILLACMMNYFIYRISASGEKIVSDYKR